MGGEGSMLHAIKSIEQNRQLRLRRKSAFRSTAKNAEKHQIYAPVCLSPEEERHMDNIAQKARYKELGIQIGLYIFILLGLYWWWFH